ncbi:hypothetical protein GW17_00034252 [Ensete ventricosum]|nr:hypothetical protein GW17_00034252 [Ensete ventricosum]
MAHIATIGLAHRPDASTSYADVATDLVAELARTFVLIEVREIANLKDLVLMQGLVHGRWSVRGHPKARSELESIEHQSFLFDMERIRP